MRNACCGIGVVMYWSAMWNLLDRYFLIRTVPNPVANAALIALMVVMLASAVAWPNIAIHLYAMTGLALGLFGSLNWVAKELQREKAD